MSIRIYKTGYGNVPYLYDGEGQSKDSPIQTFLGNRLASDRIARTEPDCVNIGKEGFSSDGKNNYGFGGKWARTPSGAAPG